MVLNASSATRTPEDQGMPFADNLWISPIPRGPHGRYGLEHVMGCYVIWKFAKNVSGASKFLADLFINYKGATTNSKLYNVPSFPVACPSKQIPAAAGTAPAEP